MVGIGANGGEVRGEANGGEASGAARRARRGHKGGETGGGPRQTSYHRLVNPFRPQDLVSADAIEAIHANALRILAELGIRVLLPEAVAVFAAAGALVGAERQIVRIGPEIIAAALRSAPAAFTLRARDPRRDVAIGPGTLAFLSGAGCPGCSDRIRGRRAGSLADFRELTQLIESFDSLHMLTAVVEPQDCAVQRRHYDTMQVQLEVSTKVPFIYARGRAQVEDSFEMLALALGLGSEFAAAPRCYTVINSNSPRQLDIPMAQGIIDFARAGQMTMITPFCLMGAMAPVTLAGALSLQHAEALAGIALAQLVRPGAPVLYGAFATNVDMKSGAPAFGTPEHVKASLISGQLARHIGLPWRGSGGAASNTADAQGAHETELAMWGALLGGANLTVHAAGWLEGGLTLGYEKLITDLEMLQVMAELCVPVAAGADELAFAAIAGVPPGGHFFAADHTMARYRSAFYKPLVADLSNFGQWSEGGRLRADERATLVWQQRLAHFEAPVGAGAAAVAQFVADRVAAGGALPVS